MGGGLAAGSAAAVAWHVPLIDDVWVMRPETRYTETVDGVTIAYQAAGSGPVDVVLLRAWHTNLEHDWDEPVLAHVFSRVASFGRLILLDRRGTGLSDRVVADRPTLEQRMDDLNAVLGALRSDRAALIGLASASMLTALYAATYPERTRALVLWEPTARGSYSPEYPWGDTLDRALSVRRQIETGWGTLEHARALLAVIAPSRADDPALADWLATNQRRSATPRSAVGLAEIDFDTDITSLLSTIQAPTLVLQRNTRNVEEGRWIANQIAGAQHRLLPGHDHMLISGETDAAIDEIERFLTGVVRTAPELDRVLATVLFTDLVDSTGQLARLGDRQWTALLDRHRDLVRELLRSYRGIEMDTAGDGFFATFDGPARAVRCALEIVRGSEAIGLNVRAGLHTGECETSDGKSAGIAVVVAARVMGCATGGEVLVSHTVRDLVAGSGLKFDGAGDHHLKGIPETWQLFRALPG